MSIETDLLQDSNFSNVSPAQKPQANQPTRLDYAPADFGPWTMQAPSVEIFAADTPSIRHYDGLDYDANRNYVALDRKNKGIVTQEIPKLPRSGTVRLQFYYARSPVVPGNNGKPALGVEVTQHGENIASPIMGSTGRVFDIGRDDYWQQDRLEVRISNGSAPTWVRFLMQGFPTVSPVDDGVLFTALSLTFPYDAYVVSPPSSPITAALGDSFPAITLSFKETVTDAVLAYSEVTFTLTVQSGGIRFANGQPSLSGTTDASGSYTLTAGQILTGYTQGASASLDVSMADGRVTSVELRTASAPPSNQNDPYYVSVESGDQQDALRGERFGDTLLATVQGYDHKPSRQGSVFFDIDTSKSSASASFANAGPRSVTNGHADATALTAQGVRGGMEYGTVYARAYGSDLQNTDLSKAPADRVANFTLRVWTQASATLEVQSGDGQTTEPGTDFANRLMVRASASGNSVDGMLLTLAITSGNAIFDPNDLEVPVVARRSDTVVLVRTTAGGAAASPLILAGPNTGAVTGTATAPVAKAPASFNLTIGGDTAYTLNSLIPDDTLLIPVGDHASAKYQLVDGRDSPVAGAEITLTIDNEQAGASFTPGAPPQTHMKQSTDASGTVEVTVYGGTKPGRATLTASVSDGQAAPHATPIRVTAAVPE